MIAEARVTSVAAAATVAFAAALVPAPALFTIPTTWCATCSSSLPAPYSDIQDVPRSRGRKDRLLMSSLTDSAPKRGAVTREEDGRSDQRAIILSITERARTVTHVANSGTLCTLSAESDINIGRSPFGSHVDYVLDEHGWPIFLLAEASLHTQNIKADSRVSLLCQTPREGNSQPQAALARVTLVGTIVEVDDDDELIQLKASFSFVHTYADQLTQSPRFKFYKLKPDKVYYVGGFGVLSKWLPVHEYEVAKPDILADEASVIVSKINNGKQQELTSVCKHFLNKTTPDTVTVTTVDRLGLDLRVKMKDLTDEYRIGFSQPVVSVEDAKSEIVKIFQEAWEKENGFEWEDQGPPIQRYAEDILRK